MKFLNYFKVNKNKDAKRTEYIISFGHPADLIVVNMVEDLILTLDKYNLILPDDFKGKEDLVNLIKDSFEEIKAKSLWYIEQKEEKVSKNDLEVARFNNFLDTGKVIQQDRVIKEMFIVKKLEKYYNQLKGSV